MMTRFQHAPLQHVPLLAHVILLPQLTTGKPLPRKKCKRVLPSQARARPNPSLIVRGAGTITTGGTLV